MYVQSLIYANIAQVHHSTNLKAVGLVQWRHRASPGIFNAPMVLLIGAAVTTYLLSYEHENYIARQQWKHAGKPIKTVQLHYKADQTKKICIASKTIQAGKSLYIDCQPMKSSTTERLVAESYCKLMSLNWPS